LRCSTDRACALEALSNLPGALVSTEARAAQVADGGKRTVACNTGADA
jgi:hypothetical protein